MIFVRGFASSWLRMLCRASEPCEAASEMWYTTLSTPAPFSRATPAQPATPSSSASAAIALLRIGPRRIDDLHVLRLHPVFERTDEIVLQIDPPVVAENDLAH